MELTGRSAKQLLPHAEEPQWTKEIENTQKNRFALRADLFYLFQFSKTPNCFTNFRLPFSKGAPLFVEIARNAVLEQQRFRTCPLKPHAGKSFRNREFLFSRPDWEREFSDLLRHGACARGNCRNATLKFALVLPEQPMWHFALRPFLKQATSSSSRA